MACEFKEIVFCSTDTDNPIKLPAAPVNIFIGSNNAGKSTALKELYNEYTGDVTLNHKIIQSLNIEWGEYSDLKSFIALEIKEQDEINIKLDTYFLQDASFRSHDLRLTHTQIEDMLKHVKVHDRFNQDLRAWFLKSKCTYLDGEKRFNLIKPMPTGDLMLPSKNHYTALLQSVEKYRDLQQYILDALGLYLTIDLTDSGKARIRLSKNKPSFGINQEQSYGPEVREHNKSAPLIDEYGDGVKAFISILLTIISYQYTVVLVDEPEIFLHPPLARKMGEYISNIAEKYNVKVFIATHSPDFVLGVLETGVDSNIIRLNRDNNISSIKVLRPDEVKAVIEKPVFRASGVFSSLFSRCAVVTEDDNDRVFYTEINYRLNKFGKTGLEEANFINTNGKDRIPELVAPLRKLGVPAAAIVDVDFLLSGGSYGALYKAAFIPESTRVSHDSLRSRIGSISNLDKGLFKKSGLDYLNSINQVLLRQSIQSMIEELEKYGVFVIRQGELESLLPDLGERSCKKPRWVVNTLELMGSDPTQANYAIPTTGDVWDLIRSIRTWVDNPDRWGMPE